MRAKKGKHLGAFDSNTGEMMTDNKGRSKGPIRTDLSGMSWVVLACEKFGDAFESEVQLPGSVDEDVVKGCLLATIRTCEGLLSGGR